MFEITTETRTTAIDTMRAIIEKEGGIAPNDRVLGDAFDAAVDIVKKQFGL